MAFSLPLPSLVLKLPITMTIMMTANKDDELLVACVVAVVVFHYFFTKEKNYDSKNK